MLTGNPEDTAIPSAKDAAMTVMGALRLLRTFCHVFVVKSLEIVLRLQCAFPVGRPVLADGFYLCALDSIATCPARLAAHFTYTTELGLTRHSSILILPNTLRPLMGRLLLRNCRADAHVS